ncbi:MAG TPA: alpha/beta fold hydrolase [Allosphingosinicella sp.]
MKKAVRILAVLAVLLVLILLALPDLSPRFIFRPERLESADPRRWQVAGEEIAFAAADGSRLSGWWVPPPGDAAPVVLLVHGRSGNIATRAGIVRRLAADGFGVLAFDYRGYGASTGSPSEEGLAEDAVAARTWLARKRIRSRRIVIVGQSLGNPAAAIAAGSRPAAGLVLVSPFTSLPDAGAARFAPFGWLPWPVNRFDVTAPLSRVTAPVLLVAARGDETVPRENALALRAAVPRAGWIEEEGGHDGLLARVVASGRLQAFVRAATTRAP